MGLSYPIGYLRVTGLNMSQAEVAVVVPDDESPDHSGPGLYLHSLPDADDTAMAAFQRTRGRRKAR